MSLTLFFAYPKAPPTSPPTASKTSLKKTKRRQKSLMVIKANTPDIRKHRKNKRKALCPNRADISYLKTTKRHRTDDQKLICQVYLQPIEMLSPAKKTIISYLSNKYLWTKCLLVIKTNKTGATACYLRRKKFLMNTVRLYQHIKTNNRSVFFGIVYQSAIREERYTLNQKKLLHTSAVACSAQNCRKKKDCFVRKSNSQTKNIQANVVYLPKFYGTKSDFQPCFTPSNRFATKL